MTELPAAMDKPSPPADLGIMEQDKRRQPLSGLLPGAEGAEFIAIPLHSLRADTATGFDLYLHVARSNRYILYRDANLVFEDRHRRTLIQSNVRYVYIPVDARDQYVRYLENHLSEVLAEPQVEVGEQSLIVYECGMQLMRDVMEKPWMAENIGRVRNVVSHTVGLVLQGPEILGHLLNLMSLNYALYSHSVNVAVYGLALAQRIGCSRRELEQLGAGLLLHDIGKIQIPPEILHKPGPLTPDEWEVIREHPRLGVEVLRQTSDLDWASLAIVLHHHERCNGTGYPQQLQAAQIHLFAKIAAIADTFDAMTSSQPHHPALDAFAAIQEMQYGLSGHFNTELLRELILILGSGSAVATPA